jgi:hypothetical protein
MVLAAASVYSSSSSAPPGISEYTRAWAGYCCLDSPSCGLNPLGGFMGQYCLPHLKQLGFLILHSPPCGFPHLLQRRFWFPNVGGKLLPTKLAWTCFLLLASFLNTMSATLIVFLDRRLLLFYRFPSPQEMLLLLIWCSL